MSGSSLIIGCDSAAVELKNILVEFLREKGYQVEDMGVGEASDDTAYAYIAEQVALKVLAVAGRRGILLCGTGIGVAIAANKIPGIRAAQIHDIFSAERAALSNDANIVTIGARVVAPELAQKLLAEWLALEFQPGPSSSKIDAIGEVERKYSTLHTPR